MRLENLSHSVWHFTDGRMAAVVVAFGVALPVAVVVAFVVALPLAVALA